MIGKFLLVVELLFVLVCGLTIQACFEEHNNPPSYGPAPYPESGPYGFNSYGDRDEGRDWHYSDSGVDHDHNGVQQNHPDWMAKNRSDNDCGRDNDRGSQNARGHDNDRQHVNDRSHDNDHGHDRDQGHGQKHDQDNH